MELDFSGVLFYAVTTQAKCDNQGTTEVTNLNPAAIPSFYFPSKKVFSSWVVDPA